MVTRDDRVKAELWAEHSNVTAIPMRFASHTIELRILWSIESSNGQLHMPHARKHLLNLGCANLFIPLLVFALRIYKAIRMQIVKIIIFSFLFFFARVSPLVAVIVVVAVDLDKERRREKVKRKKKKKENRRTDYTRCVYWISERFVWPMVVCAGREAIDCSVCQTATGPVTSNKFTTLSICKIVACYIGLGIVYWIQLIGTGSTRS